MITCKECGGSFLDLGIHLRTKHGLSSVRYQEKYPGALISDPEMVAARVAHRDHAAATAKATETFAASGKYEGGHPLKDPTKRAEMVFTRKASGAYLDMEKVVNTNLERYGVEHHAQTEERRETSRALMQKLNKDRKPASCPDPEAFKELCAKGTTRAEMRRIYGFKSDDVFKRWEDELGIPRGGAYKKRNNCFSDHQQTVQ